jgi:hypothetical protein
MVAIDTMRGNQKIFKLSPAAIAMSPGPTLKMWHCGPTNGPTQTTWRSVQSYLDHCGIVVPPVDPKSTWTMWFPHVAYPRGPHGPAPLQPSLLFLQKMQKKLLHSGFELWTSNIITIWLTIELRQLLWY